MTRAIQSLRVASEQEENHEQVIQFDFFEEESLCLGDHHVELASEYPSSDLCVRPLRS